MTTSLEQKSSISPQLLSKRREKRVADQLRDKLPKSEYKIVLNIGLAAEKYSKQGKILDDIEHGEIDIVVLHQSGEIILIELKHGQLNIKGNKITKKYWGEEKDVLVQIEKNNKKLVTQLKKANINICPFDLLLTPDQNINKKNLDIDKKIKIIGKSRVGDLSSIIKSLIKHENETSPLYQEIKDFFDGYFISINPPSEEIRIQNEFFESEVGYISEFLSNFQFSPYRLRIKAVAGSGKSLFGYRFFEEKINEKKSVMYVCVNNSLAMKTRIVLHDYINGKVNSEIRTFFDLCKTFLEEFEGKEIDPDRADFKWEYLTDQTRKVIGKFKDMPMKWQFDSIIIDEGQDFKFKEFEVLKLFLKDKNKGDILWLEDQEQNTFGRKKIEVNGFAQYTCIHNFRTPQKIASYILKDPKYNFIAANAFAGDVGAQNYSSDSEQEKIVVSLIDDLLKQGFDKENIVILTCYGYKRSQFFKMNKLGKYVLKKETGEFNDFGEIEYSDGDIAYNSVQKFKGSDAPVVILVDIDSKEIGSQYDKILYCGMTRATNKLCLLYKKSPKQKEKNEEDSEAGEKSYRAFIVDKNFANGDHYKGEWLEDIGQHGIGTYTWKNNGGVYAGQWQNRRQHGSGSYTVNGNTDFGQWINGKRNGVRRPIETI